jgi:hypothetical protein
MERNRIVDLEMAGYRISGIGHADADADGGGASGASHMVHLPTVYSLQSTVYSLLHTAYCILATACYMLHDG